MLGGLNNLANKTHQAALTGPMQRGDLQVIKKHIEALNPYPFVKKLYKSFGLLTISLTNHSKEKTNELNTVLRNNKL